VMKMRPAGEPGHADIANGLSLLDACAITHAAGKAAHMRVQGAIRLTVADDNDVAVAAFLADKLDSAIARCANRCAAWCSIVHAAMCANGIQNRVSAIRVKARTDSGKLDWCTDKFTTHGVALRVKIFSIAASRLEAEGNHFSVAIPELSHQDVAVTDFFAIQ